MNIEQTIRNYLPDIIHVSLATCRDGQPWVCEVHYAYDEALNLYFRSKMSRRHSQEIASNNRIAGNIVTQHSQGDKPRGVYFEGTAELLADVDEQNVAYEVLSHRFGLDTKILTDAQSPDGNKFYKITVSKYYLFDARESSPSQKYELDWATALG